MSRAITLGQYLPGRSLLHLLNPRFKLVALGVFLFILFWLRSFAGQGVLAVFLLLLAWSAQIPFRYLLRGMRPLLYIVLITLIVYVFFTKGGVVLLRLGPITVESLGLTRGLFIVLRLVLLVLLTLLVTLTTTPLALTDGLQFFLKPLKVLRLPVEEVVMIMTIALRFIPTLLEESQRLMRAQMARGANFETGHFFTRARNLTPLIVPLFAGAFRRADQLALAMEARGYQPGAPRTRLRENPVAARDWATLAFSLAGLAAALLWGR